MQGSVGKPVLLVLEDGAADVDVDEVESGPPVLEEDADALGLEVGTDVGSVKEVGRLVLVPDELDEGLGDAAAPAPVDPPPAAADPPAGVPAASPPAPAPSGPAGSDPASPWPPSAASISSARRCRLSLGEPPSRAARMSATRATAPRTASMARAKVAFCAPERPVGRGRGVGAGLMSKPLGGEDGEAGGPPGGLGGPAAGWRAGLAAATGMAALGALGIDQEGDGQSVGLCGEA